MRALDDHGVLSAFSITSSPLRWIANDPTRAKVRPLAVACKHNPVYGADFVHIPFPWGMEILRFRFGRTLANWKLM